jgi:hypothetical protein
MRAFVERLQALPTDQNASYTITMVGAASTIEASDQVMREA